MIIIYMQTIIHSHSVYKIMAGNNSKAAIPNFRIDIEVSKPSIMF